MVDWIRELFNEWGISMATAIATLVKALLAGVISLALGKHGLAFGAFLVLMFVDTVTKWYAVGKIYVANTCEIPLDDVTTWQSIKGIYQCWGRDGYLCASEGRKKWERKMGSYLTLTIGAVFVDVLVKGMLPNDAVLRAVWFYFGINEAGSILSNLNMAGIHQVQPL